jgi:integrase
LESLGFSSSAINQALSAIRRLGFEAADAGMLDPNVAAAVGRVKGVPREGRRTGNWLTKEQARLLLAAPDSHTFTGKRDRALLAVLLGAGLRRNEARDLAMEHVQMRDARWCIVDLVGKQGKARTIPMAAWTKLAIDEWTAAAGIAEGRVFRPVRCNGTLAGDRLSPQTIFRIVLEHSGRVGVQIRPHDARRTFARLAFYGGSGMELRDVATTLLDCALRPEECFRLRWDQVRDGALHILHGKTESARRVIPLSDRAAAVVACRRQGEPSSSWVFPAQTKSWHIEKSSLKKQHLRAIKDSKVPAFVLYECRHTCLTRWAEHMDPYTLAYLAGHSDFAMTKRYVHPQRETIRKAMAKVQGGHTSGHTTSKTASGD